MQFYLNKGILAKPREHFDQTDAWYLQIVLLWNVSP